MGRPQISLRNDDDRYMVAYYLARRMTFPTDPQTTLMRYLVVARYGVIGSHEKAVAFVLATLKGEEIHLEPQAGVLRGRNDPGDARWQNRDWSNAWADDCLRKCRAFETRLEQAARNPGAADADALADVSWVENMVNAWTAILAPWTHPRPLAVARFFALQAGEGLHFDVWMKPYFLRFSKLLSG